MIVFFVHVGKVQEHYLQNPAACDPDYPVKYSQTINVKQDKKDRKRQDGQDMSVQNVSIIG